jgi:ubiquinone/menaquinone biosynthesis C-methylase UbiE
MIGMGFYDRYILPPLINLACGGPAIARQRRIVVPAAEGVVLELGFGSGHNLPFYDRSKVTRLYGLEPSEGMLAQGRARTAKAGLRIDILRETAETLSLAPASVDTVLVTFSLCTIPDPGAALRAARRALKPGGRRAGPAIIIAASPGPVRPSEGPCIGHDPLKKRAT